MSCCGAYTHNSPSRQRHLMSEMPIETMHTGPTPSHVASLRTRPFSRTYSHATQPQQTREGKLDHCTDTRYFKKSNLRLHKIAPNSPSAIKAYLAENHTKGINDMDFCGEMSPMQHSLGMCWETTTDTFTFRVSLATSHSRAVELCLP